MARSTLVFVHALGASRREWDQVIDRLPGRECVALDCPGFGEAADAGHVDVAGLVDWLADEIRVRELSACLLVGHSLGGKVVTLLAARAAAGEIGLAGVLGVVLVTASPPSPEPIDEARRTEMIGWFTNGQPSRINAEAFVDDNTSAPLPNNLREQAIADVLRSNPTAWIGWLERGSCEDWSARAGIIDIPALIIAGADDGDLGEDNQRRLNVPHYTTVDVTVVADAAHLIPYEQPGRLAALIAAHADRLANSALPPGFTTVLNSERVSRATRAAMLRRMRAPAISGSWNAEERSTVAALIAHILPDQGADRTLADRVLAGVDKGMSDGWRFATLPPDRDAWTQGLATLNRISGGYPELCIEDQADWLTRIASGQEAFNYNDGLLSPTQMRLWFEDVRAEIARVWMSLPATLAAIGYDGFANGGDGPRKQGYVRTRADEIEDWQRRPETQS